MENTVNSHAQKKPLVVNKRYTSVFKKNTSTFFDFEIANKCNSTGDYVEEIPNFNCGLKYIEEFSK